MTLFVIAQIRCIQKKFKYRSFLTLLTEHYTAVLEGHSLSVLDTERGSAGSITGALEHLYRALHVMKTCLNTTIAAPKAISFSSDQS